MSENHLSKWLLYVCETLLHGIFNRELIKVSSCDVPVTLLRGVLVLSSLKENKSHHVLIQQVAVTDVLVENAIQWWIILSFWAN